MCRKPFLHTVKFHRGKNQKGTVCARWICLINDSAEREFRRLSCGFGVWFVCQSVLSVFIGLQVNRPESLAMSDQLHHRLNDLARDVNDNKSVVPETNLSHSTINVHIVVCYLLHCEGFTQCSGGGVVTAKSPLVYIHTLEVIIAYLFMGSGHTSCKQGFGKYE